MVKAIRNAGLLVIAAYSILAAPAVQATTPNCIGPVLNTFVDSIARSFGTHCTTTDISYESLDGSIAYMLSGIAYQGKNEMTRATNGSIYTFTQNGSLTAPGVQATVISSAEYRPGTSIVSMETKQVKENQPFGDKFTGVIKSTRSTADFVVTKTGQMQQLGRTAAVDSSWQYIGSTGKSSGVDRENVVDTDPLRKQFTGTETTTRNGNDVYISKSGTIKAPNYQAAQSFGYQYDLSTGKADAVDNRQVVENLSDGSIFTGTVNISRSGDTVFLSQTGTLKNGVRQSTLSYGTQNNMATGAADSVRTEQVVELLEDGGTFTGTVKLNRSGNSVVTSKTGKVTGQAFTGQLSSSSNYNSGTGALTMLSALDGTWMVGGKKFVGKLSVSRSGSNVVVTDTRVQQ